MTTLKNKTKTKNDLPLGDSWHQSRDKKVITLLLTIPSVFQHVKNVNVTLINFYT